MRDVEFWGNRKGKEPVAGYLDWIDSSDHKNFVLINSLILKLAESGEAAIDGIKIKKMRFEKGLSKYQIIEIKKSRYRIYTLLTANTLFLLEGHDKKENNLRKNISNLIISRAKDIIIKFHNEL